MQAHKDLITHTPRCPNKQIFSEEAESGSSAQTGLLLAQTPCGGGLSKAAAN